MYGHARFMPPVRAARESTTTSFRWFLSWRAEEQVEDRHERRNLSSGRDQGGEKPPSEPPRAEAVDQDAHRNAFARLSRQAFDQGLAPLIAAQDVRRDMDARRAALDQADDAAQ